MKEKGKETSSNDDLLDGSTLPSPIPPAEDSVHIDDGSFLQGLTSSLKADLVRPLPAPPHRGSAHPHGPRRPRGLTLSARPRRFALRACAESCGVAKGPRLISRICKLSLPDGSGSRWAQPRFPLRKHKVVGRPKQCTLRESSKIVPRSLLPSSKSYYICYEIVKFTEL